MNELGDIGPSVKLVRVVLGLDRFLSFREEVGGFQPVLVQR